MDKDDISPRFITEQIRIVFPGTHKKVECGKKANGEPRYDVITLGRGKRTWFKWLKFKTEKDLNNPTGTVFD